jgi:hypothetical protein
VEEGAVAVEQMWVVNVTGRVAPWTWGDWDSGVPKVEAGEGCTAVRIADGEMDLAVASDLKVNCWRNSRFHNEAGQDFASYPAKSWTEYREAVEVVREESKTVGMFAASLEGMVR